MVYIPEKYAMTYMRHYELEVSFDDDLEEMVGCGDSWEQEGYCVVKNYYEWLDGEWVPVDVASIKAALNQHRLDILDFKITRLPYRVYLIGPEEVVSYWSTLQTEEEAVEHVGTLKARGYTAYWQKDGSNDKHY